MENYGNIKAINYKIDGLKDGLRIVNLIKSIFSKKNWDILYNILARSCRTISTPAKKFA